MARRDHDEARADAVEPAAGPERPTESTETGSLAASREVALLEEGGRVGRYLVLRVAGEGGMGVVYEAYDPGLDRRVALKLIRVRGCALDTAGARDRLLREAQALAQLSHPNVIAVHDIGLHDGQVFVAMELVRGETLKTWLAERRRSPGEVLRLLSAAGRGLAAAHDAGMIHRDFKPENVLVGADGRVRVIDFGLARVASAEEPADGGAPPAAEPATSTSSADRLRAPLTVLGSAVGTPPYMAPEQYLSRRLDQHTDQYSFCVTLWEALHGARPFEGRTRQELRDNILAGRIRPPDRSRRVPRWLQRIVLRGLSVEPSARFPDMHALLRELERVPRARRRLAAAAAAIVGLSAAAAGVVALQPDGEPSLCRGASEQLAGVWDAGVQRAIRSAFEGSGRAHAPDTYARVAALLDERARAWVAMRTDACEATHVRGEQSERLLDLRMRCLDRRLAEMSALTRLFASGADEAVVDGAVRAVYRLPDFDQCADAAALTAEVPPPAAAVADRVARTRADLEDARALERAGKIPEGLERVAGVVADAESVGYEPLLAEALYVRGLLELDSRDPAAAQPSLTRSAELAARSGDVGLFARASVALIEFHGSVERRHREALVLVPVVRAALALGRSDPVLRAKLGALAGHQLVDLGELEAARAEYEAALADAERALGPDHPEVAALYSGLASTFYRRGAYGEAVSRYERALASAERALGPEHPNVATDFANLAYVLMQMGRLDDARSRYERAIGIFERQLGPDHPDTAWALNDLGLLEAELRNWPRALELYERSIRILEAKLGPDHPDLSFPLVNLGAVAIEQRRFDDALAHCRRAQQVRARASEGADAYDAFHLDCIGRAHLERGAPAQAIEPLEAALASYATLGGEPVEAAEAQFALARALWLTGRDRRRAVALASMARDAYAAAGDHRHRQRVEVERWLAARR